MATRKTTALATRKRTPTHQPITKPQHSQRDCECKISEENVEKVIAKKSRVITPEDELAVVVMEIDDAQDDSEEGEDRGPGMAERRLEKWLALLASCPMDVILSKYKAEIEEEIAGTKVMNQLDVKEHLAKLCAVVLLAQERCSQGRSA